MQLPCRCAWRVKPQTLKPKWASWRLRLTPWSTKQVTWLLQHNQPFDYVNVCSASSLKNAWPAVTVQCQTNGIQCPLTLAHRKHASQAHAVSVRAVCEALVGQQAGVEMCRGHVACVPGRAERCRQLVLWLES